MIRLTLFELEKIWRRRSFLLAACGLLFLNLFFLWYANTGNETKPDLFSYKAFTADIAGMSESEKAAFLTERKQLLDGVSFVESVLAMQNSETGAGFAAQEMAENPGVFEAYREQYESGDYLRYTSSLELERSLIQELYDEERKTASYASWLRSIQERQDSLNGISIFSQQDQDTFSSRNIQKSAEDYKALSSDGIQWTPSKTIVSTIEATGTDVILILLAFFFTGGLITEEKQKHLFPIIRSTKYGKGRTIASKLLALLIHCLVISALLYGSNLLYFGSASGWCNMGARVQSLAPYMESSLSVSISGFLFLSILTKALVLFGVNAMLAAFCILSETMILPYLAGLGFWAVSFSLYRFLPAASKISVVKYSNLFGLLHTENLYGKYLNFDLWGRPVSRLALSWILIGAILFLGSALSFLFFVKGETLQYKHAERHFSFPFRPHVSLFRHESYKILIYGHGLVLLFLFCFLIGRNDFSHTYTPTSREQYYQDLMLRLEGTLTEEKDALLKAETERYQEAFANIEHIDHLTASGEISSETGEAMKLKWYNIVSFYPEFQRVLEQSELVRSTGSRFVYDTGYLYLLHVFGEDSRKDFLLLTLGILLAFSHSVSMEYQCGVWGLLCATAKGKRQIIKKKAAVCAVSAAAFSVFPLIFRFLTISLAFPIRSLSAPACSIPFYQDLPPFLPAAALILAKALLQAAVGLLLTFAVFLLSGWRKHHVQTILLGFLLLCGPVVLAFLGWEPALRFSLYPVYVWTL